MIDYCGYICVLLLSICNSDLLLVGGSLLPYLVGTIKMAAFVLQTVGGVVALSALSTPGAAGAANAAGAADAVPVSS